MKCFLDTNVLSEIRKYNCDPRVKNYMDMIPLDDIFISVLSIGEIAYGIEKLPEGNKKTALSLWLNNQMPRQFENRIIPLGIDEMLEWGKLRAGAAKTPSPIDCLIAATALVHRLTLLTRNTRDFAVLAGLSLINPWD
ncbi:MAG: type II toxin-antitoxin system VapC family toxin [Treponema sp.]|jgi:predicted nucleic acid-binding protein|nr:type II toxin-antitoxin system VapC family toxin [Treponema sp.]